MSGTARYHVISVESRKGGVGKTTIALTVAKHLLPVHNVIFLDLDIAGTSAAAIAKAPLWRDHIFVVEHKARKIQTLNLIEVFQDYMEGAPVGSPCLNKSTLKEHGFTLAPDKINVFSSFMWRKAHDKSQMPYEPSVVFDEMHTLYFIEMLKAIVGRAANTMSGKAGKKSVVVVVDNAPGYSGLEPAVEEWLTDLGPERGKFLYVTSLDVQDLTACASGLRELHSTYEEKWYASLQFRDLRGLKASGLAPQKNMVASDVFLQRLIELSPDKTAAGKCPRKIRECTGCGFCFYSRASASEGALYLSEPSGYLGIIINKVPELLMLRDGEQAYDVAPVLNEVVGKEFKPPILLEQLRSNDYKLIPPELLTNQWFDRRIQHLPELTLHFMADRFVKRASSAPDRVQSPKEELRAKLLNPPKMLSSVNRRTVKRVTGVKKYISSTLKQLVVADEFLRELVLEAKRVKLLSISRFWSRQFFIGPCFSLFEQELPLKLETLTERLLRLSKSCQLGGRVDRYKLDLLIFIALRFVRQGEERTVAHLYQLMLKWIADINEGSEEQLHTPEAWSRLQGRASKKSKVDSLIRSFCIAEMRLTDLQCDFQFLLNCLRALSRIDSETLGVIGVIMQVAQQVVVEKRLNHESAEVLIKELQSLSASSSGAEISLRALSELTAAPALDAAIKPILGEKWHLV